MEPQPIKPEAGPIRDLCDSLEALVDACERAKKGCLAEAIQDKSLRLAEMLLDEASPTDIVEELAGEDMGELDEWADRATGMIAELETEAGRLTELLGRHA